MSTRATTTSRPTATTASGASTSAGSVASRSRPSCARRSARAPGHYRARAGDRRGHRLLHAQHARRRDDRAGDLHRHLARDARDAEWQREQARLRGSQPRSPTPSACRSPMRASSSCSVTRCFTTSPTCRRPSRSFSACSSQAARCCSPASRRSSATIWRRCPSARRSRSRRCGVARSARAASPHVAFARRVAARSGRRRARLRPRRAVAAGRRRRPSRRQDHRRGAAGQLVRLGQPHARGDRRARRRAVGLAPVRLPGLSRAATARRPLARVAAAGVDLLQPDDRGDKALRSCQSYIRR